MTGACLSTALFPQPPSSGVAEEQVSVCRAWLYTLWCGDDCADSMFSLTLHLSRGNNCKQGEAQCFSVQLLVVLTAGECESEGVLHNLLQQLGLPSRSSEQRCLQPSRCFLWCQIHMLFVHCAACLLLLLEAKCTQRPEWKWPCHLCILLAVVAHSAFSFWSHFYWFVFKRKHVSQGESIRHC